MTAAAVPDSPGLEERLVEGDPTTARARADTGERCAQVFAEGKVPAKPLARAARNKPLNGSQQRNHRARSRTRVRVEPVFATMRMRMRSAWPRCIGLTGTRAVIALTSLVYPLVRLAPSERLGLKNWKAA